MDQQAFRREQMLASGLLRAPEPPPALVLAPRPLTTTAPTQSGAATNNPAAKQPS